MRLPFRLAAVGVLLTVAASLGASASASACSCLEPDIERDFATADAVFIGDFVEVRAPDGLGFGDSTPARWIFSVEQVFKGDVFETQSIVTPASGASCGLELDRFGRFLIFGYKDGQGVVDNVEDGEYSSSLCVSNQRLPPEEVPPGIGTGTTPLAGSSPIGSSGIGWLTLAASAAAVIALVSVVTAATLRRGRSPD